jgi:hypothetical protein
MRIFPESLSTARRKTQLLRLSRKLRTTSAHSVTLLTACWLLAGCAPSETLFESDFTTFIQHNPPVGNEKVGTTEVDPYSDQYVWASNGWVFISRAWHVDPVPAAGLLCKFAKFEGDGTYVFSAILRMSTVVCANTTCTATIQFEPFNQPVTSYGNGFLHLDLMPDKTVRIDDNDATRFGTFPWDQEFILQVTLKINATPTAHIVLSGAGASGESDYSILPPFVPAARQFGAARLWMGLPWTGAFSVTNIVVTRNQ